MKQKPATFDQMLGLLEQKKTDDFLLEFSQINDENERVNLLAYNNAAIFSSLNDDVFNTITTKYYDVISTYRIFELYEYAKNAEFEKFKKSLSTFHLNKRINVLSSTYEMLLFQVVYKNFKISDLLSLITDCLPGEISSDEESDFLVLLKHCRTAYPDDINKAKLVIVEFLTRIPVSMCRRQNIAFFSVFMLQDAFIPFIKRQPIQNLPLMYFTAIKSNDKFIHIFSSILKHQGPHALYELLNHFPPQYQESLTQELMKSIGDGELLYQTLLSYKDSKDLGVHQDSLLQIKILELLNETLTDRVRSGLVMSIYDNLSWPAINLLLKGMDHPTRLQLLLNPMQDLEQNTLAEKLALENPDAFMRVLNTFSNEEGKFLIFSTPVKYAEISVYANNSNLNATVEAFSSVISWIPALGTDAQQNLESLQGRKEVNEFMLLRMLQRNPSLISCLPELLSGCTGRQLNILFQNQDSTKTNLYTYLARGNEAHAVIKILAQVDYAVDDREKIFNPKTIDFSELRKLLHGAEDKSALIGFLGLLTLYNYIAVRHKERIDADYQKSFTEFNTMLNVLLINKSDRTITKKLHTHCQQNPLRQAWGISLATSIIQLSSQRHHDARENLLTLEADELQNGIILFQQFIALRYNLKNEVATHDIDSVLMNTCFPETRANYPSLRSIHS